MRVLPKTIREVLSRASAATAKDVPVTVRGWVQTARRQRGTVFARISDGSCTSGVQVVVPDSARITAPCESNTASALARTSSSPPSNGAGKGTEEATETLDAAGESANAKLLSTGASAVITGTLVESPGRGQSHELVATQVQVVGACPPGQYPLQKKAHSAEVLRTPRMVHLRPRTRLLGASLRVRHAAESGATRALDDEGFLRIAAPVITGLDCEGAGETFAVSAGAIGAGCGNRPKTTPEKSSGEETGSGEGPDSGEDRRKPKSRRQFFGGRVPASLTVSAQLHLEAACSGLSRVYSLGPTFRAENSHTTRHLAEFWMLEPEFAFGGLDEAIALAERVVAGAARESLERCSEDVAVLRASPWAAAASAATEAEGSPRCDAGESQIAAIERAASWSPGSGEGLFARMTYTDAVEALGSGRVPCLERAPRWGESLSTAHEKALADDAGRPVAVTHYPSSIKPFYMRRCEDDAMRTVKGFDVLFPGIGEVFGGAQREERADVLQAAIADAGLDARRYSWYVDLARFGGVPHAGFGVGVERLVMWITGLGNIRETVLAPRTEGSCVL